MKKSTTKLFLAMLVCMVGMSLKAAAQNVPSPKGKWTFENASNLLEASEGALQLQAATIGNKSATLCETAAEAGITATDGPTAENKAILVPKNAALWVALNAEKQISNYTVQLDFMVKDATPYDGLFQTDIVNENDGDIFVHNNTIGVGTLGYGGTIVNKRWYRLLLVNRSGIFSLYVDGELISTNADNATRFIIEPEGFYLCCDEDGEATDTYVSEVAYWDEPLTNDQIATYGNFEQDALGGNLTKDENGFYLIGTAEELVTFADLVYAGETNANAKLTADIDFSNQTDMIGTSGNPYAGTFDGKGHKVTVNYTAETEYSALFQYVGAGTVKNLIVDGNIETSAKYGAGIVGNLNGGKVSHCISKVRIQSSVSGDGTHGGIAAIGTGNAIIEFTLSAVGIYGDQTTNCGGVVGWLSGATYLESVLQVADVELSTLSGSSTFCRNAGNMTQKNCFYVNAMGTVENGVKAVTADQLLSGEVAYLLNGTQDEINWYQTIGTDQIPTPFATSAQVYAVGDVRCDGTAVSGTFTYSNENTTPKPDHQYKDGFCTVCGAFQSDFVTPDADGYYNLDSAGKLEWFAYLVNNGKNTANGRLTGPIDLYTYVHTPIGTPGKPYGGTFDGGLQPITNLNNMLFGTIAGANLTNIAIESGSVTMNTTYGSHTGTIAGTATTACNLTNSYSKANIYGTTNDAGGLIGKMCGNIDRCYYAGEIDGQSTTGGIIGSGNDSSIPVLVSNCFVYSAMMTGNPTYLGNFVGYLHGICVLRNCYGNPIDGVERMCGYTGGVVQNTQVVPLDAFASGEVAYNVNEKSSDNPVFRQTLGTDPYPVIDPSHAIVYANGQLRCDGSVEEGTEITYGNTQTSVRPDHEFVDGVCINCGAVDPDFAQLVDGYYEIGTAGALEWFANKVNNGDNSLNARLIAPIDFSDVNHTPIGTAAFKYSGTFDGQFYPITNINQMLFGTIAGATITRVAIESGNIGENTEFAAHTGSIAGNCGTSAPSTITYCYSKADMTGGTDVGGIAGKYYGTIDHCYFAGTIDGTSTVGGIIGSSYDDDHVATVTNCYVYAEVLNGNETYRGHYVGYAHGANSITKCWGWSPANKDGGYNGGTMSVTTLNQEDFATGRACYLMNGSSFINPDWFQTLGEDFSPTFDETHGLVYKISDEEYACQTDNQSLKEMVSFLISEAGEFSSSVIATTSLIDAYASSLGNLPKVTTREELYAAYQNAESLRKSIDASAAAYDAYDKAVQNIITDIQEHEGEIAGPDLEFLLTYIEDEIEPGEDYPRGSYPYIMTYHELGTGEVQAEVGYVKSLYETAVANGYSIDSEITRMITNADLTDGYNGWQGKVGTGTGGVASVMTAGECWNNTFDMYQTITGLSDGVYELLVNAAYRPYTSIYSTQYVPMLYANDNKVYISNVCEDMVLVEDAIDQVNCYITEGGSNPDYEYQDEGGNVIGYCLHGYNSCSYGFSAGRHLNRILAYVTDGKLTVGLKSQGSGLSSDWTGFANFRLFYRGSIADATAALDETLAGQVTRANTIMAYEYSSDSNDDMYKKYPNFSQALKDELQQTIIAAANAEDNETKYQIIEKFSALFQEIYDTKMAYVQMINEADQINSSLFEIFNQGGVTQEQLNEGTAAYDAIWAAYEAGSYTKEEALSMEALKQTSIYQMVHGAEPELVDGVYQIETPQNLLWLSSKVNAGQGDVKAIQTAPLDMSQVLWHPIGNTSNMFKGTYDGQFYPITNIQGMFIGMADGATVTRVAIESGNIASNTDIATHCGSIIGAVGTNNPCEISYCYSKADMSGGTDVGGIAGKYYGTMNYCFFAGTIDGTSTVGGLIGSSHDGTYGFTAKNCFVYTNLLVGNVTYLGDLIGYCHGGSSFHDIWTTSTIGKVGGYMGGSQENINFVSEEDFYSGIVAYSMNEVAPTTTWYQNLGEDLYPVLNPTHKTVIISDDGTIANGDPGTSVETIDMTSSERTNVYDIQGRLIRTNVAVRNSLINLPKGLYIVGGKKVQK